MLKMILKINTNPKLKNLKLTKNNYLFKNY